MSEILNHKCPGCGSPLRFDSESHRLHCDACGADISVDDADAFGTAAGNMSDSADWSAYTGESWDTAGSSDNDNNNGGMSTYVCPSCGAEIVTDTTTAVTKCPYCDNVTVVGGNLSGAYRPELVIPFSISAEEARICMEEFCRKKILLPRRFLDELHLDEAQGLYVPFWLFDCSADARMTFIGTKVRRWSDKNYNYTETSRYSVFRRGGMSFSKIPVDGSRKADDTLMESVEPYDYSELREFGSGYLSGFVADRYDVDDVESRERANARVKRSVEAALAATVIGYSSVVPSSSSVNIQNGRVQYALLPVWLLHYHYRDKTFTYAINGQTGKTVGKLPISWGRAAALFGAVYAAAAAVIAGILLLL